MVKPTAASVSLVKDPTREREREQKILQEEWEREQRFLLEEQERKERLAQEERERRERLVQEEREREERALREEREREERILREAKRREERERRAEADRQKQEQERIILERAQKEAAWRQKLRSAEEKATLIESFDWADKTSVDRYLYIRSLAQRGQECERRLAELYRPNGAVEASRELGMNLLVTEAGFLQDSGCGWLKDLLECYRFEAFKSRWDGLPVKTKIALRSIHWLLYDLQMTSSEIAIILHNIRFLERTRVELCLLPELFCHGRTIQKRVSFLLEEVESGVRMCSENIHRLKMMARNHYPARHARLRAITDPYKMVYCVTRLSLDARRCRSLAKIIAAAPGTAVQEHWLAEFEHAAFSVQNGWTELQPLIYGYYAAASDDLQPTESKMALLRRIAYIKVVLSKETKGNHRVLGVLSMWRGISMLATAHPHQATRRSPPIGRGSASVQPSARGLSAPKYPVDPSYIPPWRDSTSLYPHGPAIPIYFVATPNGIHSVLPKFSHSTTVAFDSIEVSGGRAVDRLEYLLLANESGVGIFHVGMMSADLIVMHQPFREILSASGVVKVGVEMDSQRQLIQEIYGVELENAIELRDCASQDRQELMASSAESRGRTISSMAARSLGSPLPTHDLAQTSSQAQRLRSTGWQTPLTGSPSDPLGVIRYLAARVYTVFQLHQMASTARQNLPRTQASLGPVLYYETPFMFHSRRHRMTHLTPAAARLARQKYAQLLSPANHSDKSVLASLAKKRTPISDLTAYFLFTTFQERLDMIATVLRMTIVAQRILAVARDLKLPLRPLDFTELDRWRLFHHEATTVTGDKEIDTIAHGGTEGSLSSRSSSGRKRGTRRVVLAGAGAASRVRRPQSISKAQPAPLKRPTSKGPSRAVTTPPSSPSPRRFAAFFGSPSSKLVVPGSQIQAARDVTVNTSVDDRVRPKRQVIPRKPSWRAVPRDIIRRVAVDIRARRVWSTGTAADRPLEKEASRQAQSASKAVVKANVAKARRKRRAARVRKIALDPTPKTLSGA